MIKNHKLLVDRDCPMCNLYGKCFMQLKLIDSHTVTPFQTARARITSHIDMDRARNEIALYDEVAEHTHYGIDAFIRILSQGRPRLRWVLRSMIVYPLLVRLYRLVSYNRKVIYPAACTSGMRQCIPDLNVKYRWTYIILVTLFTSFIVNRYTTYFDDLFDWPHPAFRDYLICFGQILWQGAFILGATPRKDLRLDYLGNMSTVALIGAILLLLAMTVHTIAGLSVLTLLGCLAAVIGIMFIEHIRRCHLLGVGLGMSGSWVLYRVAVLTVLLVLTFQ